MGIKHYAPHDLDPLIIFLSHAASLSKERLTEVLTFIMPNHKLTALENGMTIR